MYRSFVAIVALTMSTQAAASCAFTGSPAEYVRCIYDETVALWGAVESLDSDVERLDTDLCDRVSFSEAEWTYTDLNPELDAEPSGHSVCGAGSHVCNAQEAGLYGILGGCDGRGAWIVGGFSNTEYHRRSVWNGQDSVQCDEGRFPTWYAPFEGYKGRIHCRDLDAAALVACCRDL